MIKSIKINKKSNKRITFITNDRYRIFRSCLLGVFVYVFIWQLL